MKETDSEIGLTGESTQGTLERDDFPVAKQLELCKKANKEFYFRLSYVIKRLTKIRSFGDIARTLKSVAKIANFIS